MSDIKKHTLGEDTVCVVGLGYVGLTLAVTFAEEGAIVFGIDSNEAIIDALMIGMPHFYEPGLEEKLEANKDRLTFSTAISDASRATAFVISVGSNVDENGNPDYSHVERSSRDIGGVLKPGDLVILRSTVTVGTTRNRVIPILEKTSGLIAGKDFFVAFAPERTIEGKALEELRTLPQVVAGLTPKCRNMAEKLFARFAKHIVPVDTLEEGEMIKLVSNAYRDLSFAFANSLALISSVHNVNVNTVIDAANEGYARNRIPLPSPGVGGYCLTKDPLLLAHGAEQHSDAGDLLKQGRAVNKRMTAHVADIVHAFMTESDTGIEPHIVVVGLAFKGNPKTSDVRFSPSEALIRDLRARGYAHISGYDPHVSPDVFDGWQIGRIENAEAIAGSGDIVIFMHRHEDYGDHAKLLFGNGSSRTTKLVLDPWGMFNNARDAIVREGLAYANMGYRSF